jgi:predicted DNA-binding protein
MKVCRYDHVIGVRLSQKQNNALERHSMKQQRSKGSLIREMINERYELKKGK